MALYTICGTTKDRTARPCAIVEAISQNEALRRAAEMRRCGDLAFLPIQVHLVARRSSRPEIETYLDFMVVRPVRTLGVGRDEGYSYRIRRLTLAFFQKLWRGDLPGSARSKPAPADTTSGGGIVVGSQGVTEADWQDESVVDQGDRAASDQTSANGSVIDEDDLDL